MGLRRTINMQFLFLSSWSLRLGVGSSASSMFIVKLIVGLIIWLTLATLVILVYICFLTQTPLWLSG
ncbi:hypothetical protein LINPERPRIM_LOCUS1404 [Linum perenne]